MDTARAARHPNAELLEQFVLGRLDREAAQSIEAHITDCADCCNRLASLTGERDPLTDRLRLLQVGQTSLLDGFASVSPRGLLGGSIPGELPTVPGYEVQAELGRGGMGVVYRARHLRLRRTVALKMILAGSHASPEEVVRFLAEAEVVAQLSNPHIVQIHEIGDHQGLPFLALEYVDGGSLAERIAGMPQDPVVSARLVAQLAQAIHVAHVHGIVHRDLKPANILLAGPATGTRQLSGKEFPKISDFGLAKWHEHDRSLTATGSIAGTPSYMAPEQARGGARGATPAVDIYALGAILYELLTGRPPFKGPTSLETLAQVTSTDPVPPRRLQPRTPRDLETIVLKCLEKEPMRRYLTADLLTNDLERFLRGDAIMARPVSLPERAWRWAKRRPAVSGLLAGLAAVAFVGVAGILWQWASAVEARQQAELSAAEARAAQRQTAEALERAERQVYFTRIAQARLEWLLNFNVVGAEALLDQCRPGPGSVDRRGWEWRYLKNAVRGQLRTLPRHQGEFVEALAFSPDGETLASCAFTPFNLPPGVRRPLEIWLTDVRTGRTVAQLHSARGPPRQVCFSPHGRTLAAVCGPEVHLIDLTDWLSQGRPMVTDLPVRVLPIEPLSASEALAFSPDGKLVAGGCRDGTVLVWSVSDATIVHQFKMLGQICGLAFSPTGERLAACVNQDRLQWAIWDLASGRETVRQDVHPGGSFRGRAAFSPNLNLLVVNAENVARIWEVESGRLMQVLSGHQGPVLDIAFSRDNSTVATGSTDSTVRLWRAASGREVANLRGHSSRVSCVAFHPSGTFLASGAQQPSEVHLWDAVRPTEYRSFQPDVHRSVEGLTFDPTGTRLLCLLPGGRLQVRDVDGEGMTVVHASIAETWRAPAMLASFAQRTQGLNLAAVGPDLRHLTLWDIDVTGAAAAVQALGELHGHAASIYQVVHSRDGNRIASAAYDLNVDSREREIIVWHPDARAALVKIKTRVPKGVRLHGGLALSADARLLAFDDYPLQNGGSAPGVEDGIPQVHVRDLSTGRDVFVLRGHRAVISSLAFSPDGKRLASADRSGRIWLWDLATGQPVHVRPLVGPAYELLFSSDGQRLTAVDRQQVKLWDAITGQEILLLRSLPPRAADPGVNPRIAWSRDSRRLAASGYDLSVTIWDAPPVRD